MADDIERFLNNKPGTINEISSLSATITQSGDFRLLTGIDALVYSVSNLLLTTKRTYVFDPDFGVGLSSYIFEPCDATTKKQIESEIGRTLAEYETRAQIDFEVLFFKNRRGFRINLYIKYGDEQATTKLDIDESILRTLD